MPFCRPRQESSTPPSATQMRAQKVNVSRPPTMLVLCARSTVRRLSDANATDPIPKGRHEAASVNGAVVRCARKAKAGAAVVATGRRNRRRVRARFAVSVTAFRQPGACRKRSGCVGAVVARRTWRVRYSAAVNVNRCCSRACRRRRHDDIFCQYARCFRSPIIFSRAPRRCCSIRANPIFAFALPLPSLGLY